MAGKTIVVTSGKGGVGKTTTVANLGTTLAKKKYRVVMIDTDIGLRNLDVVMGLENRIVYNLVDIIEGKCRKEQAMIRDRKLTNLFMIPAAQTREKNSITPEQMKELCCNLADEFEYVLIDCPAGIEQGFKNATAGANQALVVTTPEVAAVRDADRIIGLLQADTEMRHPKLILNRYRPKMVKRGDMLDVEDVKEHLAIELLGIVPEDESIIISTNKGEPAVLNVNSKAGEAYRNIARRIMGEDVPLMDIEENGAFMNRIRRLLGLRTG